MKTTIPVDEAIGLVLPHDITEIRRGEFKGAAFKKGHIIRAEDIPHLKRLGKERIYLLKLGPTDIHENEAAIRLAAALAGPGTTYSKEPVEGKLNILAARDGLLCIDTEALFRFNLLAEVMCATLHSDTLVRKGEQVAATRLIPLVGKRALIEEAERIAPRNDKIIQVLPLRRARVGLVITGNEVYSGRIQDGFEQVLRDKLAGLDSEILMVRLAPDNEEMIAAEIENCLTAGADLIITTGGMSVDPDDVTQAGIRLAGATDMLYGTPVLPGAMFLLATINNVPVLGLPACAMFHRITVFDLILPRILAGQPIDRQDLARMGHGGLCRNCKTCRYPVCDFGR
ncbi:MAG: molybdopterin-binding protein [Deltaproteobacteria bacterium RIFOXYD12_FULL_57_12]|nr:MAG: molybdopterin-binding protein [Deltaproteobacteria bacterium RIFOXYD12_FULL_57_12]